MLTTVQKQKIDRIALKNLWNMQKTGFFIDLIKRVDEETGNIILQAWD